MEYAENNEIDLFVPLRAQVQKFDGKDQTLSHDKYEYYEEKDELIVDGEMFSRREVTDIRMEKELQLFIKNQGRKVEQLKLLDFI